MANGLTYAGPRTPYKAGDSTVVSLPRRALRSIGVDVDELEGQELQTRIEDGEFIVSLDGVQGEQ